MPNIVDIARQVATDAHMGQFDKAGVPYIEHPMFVASQVDGDDTKAAAYLHDVLEDTAVEVNDLKRLFPESVIDAVLILTKIKGEEYEVYLTRVKENSIARLVKISDLRHNMMMNRIPEPTEADYMRIIKYEKALEYLMS